MWRKDECFSVLRSFIIYLISSDRSLKATGWITDIIANSAARCYNTQPCLRPYCSPRPHGACRLFPRSGLSDYKILITHQALENNPVTCPGSVHPPLFAYIQSPCKVSLRRRE
eukprot:2189477-Pyramimonas_sp.AAC.1